MVQYPYCLVEAVVPYGTGTNAGAIAVSCAHGGKRPCTLRKYQMVIISLVRLLHVDSLADRLFPPLSCLIEP